MNVDLRQLRVFLAIARLGNFTRAAERLHLSQPSLSQHLRHLEGALGIRLFDRSTRSVALTTAGEDFLPVAERLVDEFDSAVASVADLAARRRGRVTVAALPSIAAEALPRAIAVLRAKNPEITVSLRDDVAEQIAARVRSGEVDFGIGATDVDETELAVSPFTTDIMVAVVPRAHPLTRAKKVPWKTLAAYPFVAMSRDSSVRRLTDQAFARNGLVSSPAFEAKYLSTALGLIAHNLGVGVFPSSALPMIAGAGLAHVVLTDPQVRRPIGILSRRGRSLSPAAAELVSILQTTLRDEAPVATMRARR